MRKTEYDMPSIVVSYETLQAYQKQHDDEGTESYVVYLVEGKESPRVRKIFRNRFGYGDYITSEEAEAIRENKTQKLAILYHQGIPGNDVEVLQLVCNAKGQVIGYDMSWDKDTSNLSSCIFTRKEEMYYLDQVEDRLGGVHEIKGVYGDITPTNILINERKKKVSFCDLDNIQVGRYPIDIYNNSLIPFRDEQKLIDKSIDTYMYNLLLLNELDPQYDGTGEILRALELGYRPSYLTKNANSVLEKMCQAAVHNQYKGPSLKQYVKVKR